MQDTTIATINTNEVKLVAFKRVVGDTTIFRLTDFTFIGATSNDDFNTEADLVEAFESRLC